MLGGLGTNKTGGLRECISCNYWYFVKVNFKFQPKVRDGCHDIAQISMMLQLLLLEKTITGFTPGTWIKVRPWRKWKILILQEKRTRMIIYIYKKIFILMMSSNTQKTITKKKKEKVREISKQYYKANKERL